MYKKHFEVFLVNKFHATKLKMAFEIHRIVKNPNDFDSVRNSSVYTPISSKCCFALRDRFALGIFIVF